MSGENPVEEGAPPVKKQVPVDPHVLLRLKAVAGELPTTLVEARVMIENLRDHFALRLSALTHEVSENHHIIHELRQEISSLRGSLQIQFERSTKEAKAREKSDAQLKSVYDQLMELDAERTERLESIRSFQLFARAQIEADFLEGVRRVLAEMNPNKKR